MVCGWKGECITDSGRVMGGLEDCGGVKSTRHGTTMWDGMAVTGIDPEIDPRCIAVGIAGV